MFLLPRTMTVFASLFLIFGLSACDSGGGSGASSEFSGYWVEENDLYSMEQLKDESGECKPYQVSSQEDLGNYYLEAIRIDSSGKVYDMATIDKDTSKDGDFYLKGQIQKDGSLKLDNGFLVKWQQAGLVVKEYEHKYTLENEKTLKLDIIKQVTVHNGETYTMENTEDVFYLISKEEFEKTVAFAKKCAQKQTLKP